MRPSHALLAGACCAAVWGTACNSGSASSAFSTRVSIVPTGINSTVTITLSANQTGTTTLSTDTSTQLAYDFTTGERYSFTASSPTQTCTFQDNAGGYYSSSVNRITLICSDTNLPVTGVINGIASGSTVSLLVNGSVMQNITANGAFTLTGGIASGSTITVSAEGTGYTCSASGNTATNMTSALSGVQISCARTHQLFYDQNRSGNLGGRSGADALCDAYATAAANCSDLHAFLSVSASDAIKDFPTTYGVRSDVPIYFRSTALAGSWSDLLDGTITGGLPTTWWAGTNSDGSVSDNNCSGWTSASINQSGSFGLSEHTDQYWMSRNYIASCNNISPKKMICLCAQNDYQLVGSVSGLNGTITVTVNDTETITLKHDGAFFSGTRLTSGTDYTVAIATQPTAQLCTITNATGTAGATMVTAQITCVSVGDTDSDGISDTNESARTYLPYVSPQGSIDLTSSNVALYRGSSTNFRIPTALTVDSTGLDPNVANTDWDGDGSSNIDEITDGTNLFVASSTGTLATASTVTLASALMMDGVVADFNGDDVLDLAAVGIDGGAGVGVVAIGNGTGGFGTASSFTVGNETSALAAADFDEDGDMDLVIANQATDNVSVILNSGTGSLSSLTNYTVGDYPHDIAVGDWNGDSHIDIAVANRGPGTVNTTLSILLGDGDGALGTATTVTTEEGPSFLTTGDFDNDGDLDLAVSHRGSGGGSTKISVFTNNGSGTFGGKTDYTVGQAPGGITTGDFDADGDLDLAVAITGPIDDGNEVQVLLNNGSGVFGTATSYGVGTGPVGVITFDVDGDNDLDLLVANTAATAGSTLALLKNDGDGMFGTATAVAVGGAPVQMAPGDFDRDGDLDVLVTNFAGGTASVVLNQ